MTVRHDHRFDMRLTDVQYKLFLAAAESQQLKMSAWVRTILTQNAREVLGPTKFNKIMKGSK